MDQLERFAVPGQCEAGAQHRVAIRQFLKTCVKCLKIEGSPKMIAEDIMIDSAPGSVLAMKEHPCLKLGKGIGILCIGRQFQTVFFGDKAECLCFRGR